MADSEPQEGRTLDELIRRLWERDESSADDIICRVEEASKSSSGRDKLLSAGERADSALDRIEE